MAGQELEKKELLGCSNCGKASSACVCAPNGQAANGSPANGKDSHENNGEDAAPGGRRVMPDKTAEMDIPAHLRKPAEASAAPQASSKPPDSELTPYDPWIGRTIKEQYEIVSLIARGGMGAVYRAKHILLGTNRAIKVIRPDLHRDDIVYQRFKQEAQAVEGLSHPNIVSFYDYGIFDHAPYVVMDLVEGQALDAAIKAAGGKLEITAALNIFSQVAGALEHAHNKGILHRDIKPSNIMLVKGDAENQSAMLLDFGIAKIQSPDGAQKITGTGEIFGSPAYMSPEQGKGQPTDARSDIYSLGCVMYESMTGKPPFEGRNAIETIMQHLNNTVPKISPPSKMADDPVFKDFEAIIMRCLEKQPEDRYANMSSLHEDLKRLSYGERLLKLQEQIASRKRANLFGRLYKYLLIAFGVAIVPYAVFSVYIDPSGWRKELAFALENPDDADKIIQQIMTDLNQDDEMYTWNKAYLLFTQAQIYRQKSPENRALSAFAINNYKQALFLLDKFAAAKTSSPLLSNQLKANCLDGLTRAFLKESEWETPANLERKVAEAARQTDPDLKEIESPNEVLAAVASSNESLRMRKHLIDVRGSNKETELLLAEALELKARAQLPFKNYNEIDTLLESQQKILDKYLKNSWTQVDCYLNRAQIMELLNRPSEALEQLNAAKEIEVGLYQSERDPFVLNIKNNIERLEKICKSKSP